MKYWDMLYGNRRPYRRTWIKEVSVYRPDKWKQGTDAHLKMTKVYIARRKLMIHPYYKRLL